MIDDIKIEPLNLDGLVEPLPSGDSALSLIAKYESGDRNVPNYRYDSGHTAQGYYQLTNTNWRSYGPRAGVNLKQYPNAMAAPKEVQASVAKLMHRERGFADWAPFNPALRAGLRRGELGDVQSQSADNLNLDGLVEPLNVEGLTESVVPPVPTGRDMFTLTPAEKARVGSTVAHQQGSKLFDLTPKEKMRLGVSGAGVTGEGKSNLQSGIERRMESLGPKSRWVLEAISHGAADIAETISGAKIFSPATAITDYATRKLTGVSASADLSRSASAMRKAITNVDAKAGGRSELSQMLQDVPAGLIGSSPALVLTMLGVPAWMAFGMQSAAQAQGRGEDFRTIVTEGAKGAAIGKLFDLAPAVKMSFLKTVGAKLGTVGIGTAGVELVSRSKMGLPGITLINAMQGDPQARQDIIQSAKAGAQLGILAGAGDALSLGAQKLRGKSIVPEVPTAEPRIGAMPNIPDVPVSTISEPRVIKRGGLNAAKTGVEQQSGGAEYQGASPRENIPAHGAEVRGVEGQQAGSSNRVGESGQINQEAPLNLTGLVEQATQPASEIDPLAQSATSTLPSVSPIEAAPVTASTPSEGGVGGKSSKALAALSAFKFSDNPTDAEHQEYSRLSDSFSRAAAEDYFAKGGKFVPPEDRVTVFSEKWVGLNKEQQDAILSSQVADHHPEVREVAPPKVEDGVSVPEGKPELLPSVDIKKPLPPQPETKAAAPQEAPKTLRRQFDDLTAASDRAYEEAKQANRVRDQETYKTKTEEAHQLAAQAGEIMKQLPATEQAEIKSNALGSIMEGFAKLGREAPKTAETAVLPLTSPIPDVPRLEDSTGINHAIVEAERELQGLPQFAKARRAHGQSFDEGVYDVQSGRIRPRELAADIVKAFYDPAFSMERFQSRRPRPLSTEESMALLYDRMRISNERKAAETELEAANESGDAARTEKALDEVSRLQQASNANDEADYVAGGEQGRGLAIRRELIKDDYSRSRVLAQALTLNKGKPLPAHITAALEEKVAELAKANERIAELEGKQQTASAHSEIEKVIEKTQREVRTQARQRNRQVLDTEAASIKDQIAAAWKRTRSGVQPSGLAGLDPEGELTKLLGMLARNRVEAGISKAADLVDAVHEMVKDVADLTKRDVQDLISGYGKTSKPQQDEIGAKLSELKAIMRVSSGKADVVEKGIRPLRSGFQRPKPTQELREALRDQRDTLREHGIEIERSARSPEDQQKSILDAAKTTTRNRIEDLTKWIAGGKRTVANKTELIPDAELNALRAERDKLQTVFDAIDDLEADQKTITRALGAANKSILDLESKIKSGEIQPKAKGAQPTSPELEAARTARKTLQDILRDMRTAERRANKPAEDPIITDARKVLAAQKAFMARNQKQMVEMQKELAEAKRIAKEGGQRPEKAKRTPTPQTDEMRVAQRNANQLRRDIDNVYSVVDWANKTKLQKGLAYGAAGVRAGVLSGVKVLGKIGGALVQRIGQQYIEEPTGAALSKIVPGSEKAPRHGGNMSAAAEADYLRGLASGAMEIPSILKTGESELSLERGKRYPNIPTKLGTILSVPGRVHAAEKNPLKVAEYNRSLERNLAWAERQGMDRANPDVIEQAKTRAFKDADEIVLLGDNPITRSLTNMQRGWKDESRSLLKMVVPVAKVPSNYLSQAVGDYGLGLVRGGLRALKQRNPELLEKLTPEEADKTMRLLKRGSLGLVYMALAASGAGGAITAGGFWSKKKKGERREVQPGDVRIGPATISHLWLHSPPAELAQFAGTIRREIENKAARRESVVKRAATGVAVGAKGTLDQVPFLSRYTRVYDSFRSGDALLKMMGDSLADWVEPQIVQELAKATDREEKGKPTVIPWKGEAVQRKAKTFGDAFLVGLPVGRQYLKKDRKKMMEMRQQERHGGVIPPVPGALNLNGLVEPSPSPTP